MIKVCPCILGKSWISCVELRAAGVILVHNHLPVTAPSENDKEIVNRIIEAGKYGTNVVDLLLSLNKESSAFFENSKEQDNKLYVSEGLPLLFDAFENHFSRIHFTITQKSHKAYFSQRAGETGWILFRYSNRRF